MLTEQTLTQLTDLRLDGMAEAYDLQRGDPNAAALSFDERFGMLVEREWNHQRNRALQRRLKRAKLRQDACIEDVTCGAHRGLTRDTLAQLYDSQWVARGQNCIITGATGVGKSYLACALAHKACRDGYKALYTYCPRLFRDLYSAHADGTIDRFLRRMGRFHLLVVDDWGMEQARRSQYRYFLEMLDERHGHGSVLITTQFPRDTWHDIVGDPTVADAISDRLVHNAYRIDLQGEQSMRNPNNRDRGDRRPSD
jgi:DNA replication protein DnaC